MSLILVLWRRKLVIAAAVVVSAVIALAVSLGLPEVYRTGATVLVTPPQYRTDVSPSPPSPETYTEIAVTPAVVQEALERAGLAGGDAGWSVDRALRRLRVETYEERGSYNTVLVSPLLGLMVTDVDPERAARLANAWAESFQEVSRLFQGRGSRRIAQALQERASSAAGRLQEAERALDEFERQALLEILERRARIQADSLAGARAARLAAEGEMERSAQVLSTLEAEAWALASGSGEAGSLGGRAAAAAASLERASAAVREYRRESSVTVMEAELAFRRELMAAYRDELRGLERRLAESTAEVARIAALLGEASGDSPAAPLRASIAGEGDDGSSDPVARLSELTLLEQLQDTALQSLRERYYGARVDAEAMGPLIDSYRDKVKELETSLPGLEEEVDRRRAELERLESRLTLERGRREDLDRLERKLHDDIASLSLQVDRLRAEAAAHRQREEALRVEADRVQAQLLQARLRRDHLSRDLDLVRGLHANLSAKAQEARAAEAGNASDVSIVSQASVPERPFAPRPALNAAAAAVFGLLASSTLIVLTSGAAPTPRP